LLLCVAALSVFIGTLYPLALETLTREKISVGPPYFNLTFGLIILPLLLLVPVGPMLSWKRGDIAGALRRLWIAMGIAGAVALLVLIAQVRGPWLAPVGMALGAWLAVGALLDLAGKIALFKMPLRASLSRLAGLPGASLGVVFAHGGLGIMVIGIIAVSLWKTEVIIAMKPGEAAQVGAYTVSFQGEAPLTGPNYTGRTGRFLISRDGNEVTTLTSEKREFKPGGMTTEVGLHQTLAGDLYVVMGDANSAGGRAMRMYFNPLVDLIWAGALLMFMGGAFSLTDRRYRIGAPKRVTRVETVAAE
jgi:cytochrome c-type biogenesis protein CcmF